MPNSHQIATSAAIAERKTVKFVVRQGASPRQWRGGCATEGDALERAQTHYAPAHLVERSRFRPCPHHDRKAQSRGSLRDATAERDGARDTRSSASPTGSPRKARGACSALRRALRETESEGSQRSMEAKSTVFRCDLAGQDTRQELMNQLQSQPPVRDRSIWPY